MPVSRTPPHPADDLIRFGLFELDLRSRELRQQGRSTGLPEQSIKVLHVLLERAGQVVLREEIRARLWPNDTIVEFDHSINTALRKLRVALGDSADEPRYIETLARRGYRWIGPTVSSAIAAAREPAQPPAAPDSPPLISAGLTGKKVSHYRVLEVLGGGGMGVVYKAEDLKLGRRVALKFLPDELAQDPRALQRLEQEARAASALNHPNVCTIYEIAEHEGRPFIVMEFLEGETLRELIGGQTSGHAALSLERQLELGIELSAALAAAHAHGIVHRDIKPANVFVTRAGAAKILDFGVAKLEPSRSSARQPLQPVDAFGQSTPDPDDPAPSGHHSLTRTGITVGTAGYMSPEQVRGEVLDSRTDLFSLGLVLYEMATGRAAFGAPTRALMREAILNAQPTPPRELDPATPEGVVRVIDRALEKERERRYQSAAEMGVDLERLRAALRARPASRWPALSAGAALLVGAALAWFWWRQPPAPAAIPVGEIKYRQLTANSAENPVTSGAISPSGRYLAYVDAQGMHVRDIEAGTTQAIAEPTGLVRGNVTWEIAGLPWFPDNTRFLANAHQVGEYEAAWPPPSSDVWMFSRLSESPQKLRAQARALSVAPDGSLIAFGTSTVDRLGDREIWVMGPGGEGARKIAETDGASGLSRFLWSAEGHSGLSVRADLASHALLSQNIHGGAPGVVLTSSQLPRRGVMSWLPDGRLIYQAVAPPLDDIAAEQACNFWSLRVDRRTGQLLDKPARLTNWTGFCGSSANATADGKRLAFLRSSGEHGTAYVADLDPAGTRIREARHFTLEEDDDFIGDWTADSKAVLIGIDRSDHYGLFKQSLDSNTPVPIAPRVPGGSLGEAIFSPDNAWVIAIVLPTIGSASDPAAPLSVVRIPTAGGAPQMLFQTVRPGPFSCTRAPATLCVIPEWTADRRHVIVTAFDPVKGRGRQLLQLEFDPGISPQVNNLLAVLSPEGTRVAFVAGPNGPIEIHSLRGAATRVIATKDLGKLWNIQWAADGKALLVAKKVQDGTALLRVDLRGSTTPLWKSMGPRCFGIESPDGRHIAIYDWRRNSNMWLMENF